ncbi:MAG: SDR family NAD(P)-dependent oxidoreductase [Polyangiales bacterium]
MNFEEKDVVVTGGTGALGRAVVGQLINAGARVHIPVFASEELAEFPYRAHAQVSLHEGLDLSIEDDVASLYTHTTTLFASIHIAGGFDMGPIAETTFAAWNHLMRLNATTCFLCCREAVRTMGSREGRIVNVAAKPVLVPTAQMTAYTASKAAVAGLTLSLSEELAHSKIWVNAVVPSIIDTPANRHAMPDADPGAWPTPAEIGETITFLASPSNAVTRGALVPVYGRS